MAVRLSGTFTIENTRFHTRVALPNDHDNDPLICVVHNPDAFEIELVRLDPSIYARNAVGLLDLVGNYLR